MHLHVRIHHWVLWWFYVGVVCGVVAVVNILVRDLTRTEDKAVLVVGLIFWALGGLVCHSYEGIQLEQPRKSPGQSSQREDSVAKQEREWHPASDFVLPGMHEHLLPPKYNPRRIMERPTGIGPATK
jgi:hypothetical protein